jgi:hypothetical protein
VEICFPLYAREVVEERLSGSLFSKGVSVLSRCMRVESVFHCTPEGMLIRFQVRRKEGVYVYDVLATHMH